MGLLELMEDSQISQNKGSGVYQPSGFGHWLLMWEGLGGEGLGNKKLEDYLRSDLWFQSPLKQEGQQMRWELDFQGEEWVVPGRASSNVEAP